MSMNLVFRCIDGSGYVDFPWQTRTDVTYAVLNATTDNEKLKILKDSISDWDADLIEGRMAQVIRLLNSPHLELTMI